MTGFNMNITLLMAFDLVKNIVERFGPAYRAEGDDGNGCVYAVEQDGILKPICIVGQMFADLGLLRVLVANKDDVSMHLASNSTDASNMVLNLCGIGNGDVFNRLSTVFGITVEPDAQEFLRVCQSVQDDGDTWLNAFETASQSLITRGFVTVSDAKARDQVWAALNA